MTRELLLLGDCRGPIGSARELAALSSREVSAGPIAVLTPGRRPYGVGDEAGFVSSHETSMSERNVISAAVIEDNRIVREGITSLLNQMSDLRVVASGSSANPELLRRVNPNVILLDLGLRNGDSLRLAERVKRDFPEAKVIVMDLLPVHEEIVEYVNAGVSGFIMKDATLEDLVDAIRSVAGGVRVLPPEMTSSLFSQIARNALATGRPITLEAVRMTPAGTRGDQPHRGRVEQQGHRQAAPHRDPYREEPRP